MDYYFFSIFKKNNHLVVFSTQNLDHPKNAIWYMKMNENFARNMKMSPVLKFDSVSLEALIVNAFLFSAKFKIPFRPIHFPVVSRPTEI